VSGATNETLRELSQWKTQITITKRSLGADRTCPNGGERSKRIRGGNFLGMPPGRRCWTPLQKRESRRVEMSPRKCFRRSSEERKPRTAGANDQREQKKGASQAKQGEERIEDGDCKILTSPNPMMRVIGGENERGNCHHL